MNASRFQLHCDFIYISALRQERCTHTHACTFLSQALMQDLANQVSWYEAVCRFWFDVNIAGHWFSFSLCGVSQCSYKKSKSHKQSFLSHLVIYRADSFILFYLQWFTTNHEHTLRGLKNKNENTLHAQEGVGGYNRPLRVIKRGKK